MYFQYGYDIIKAYAPSVVCNCHFPNISFIYTIAHAHYQHETESMGIQRTKLYDIHTLLNYQSLLYSLDIKKSRNFTLRTIPHYWLIIEYIFTFFT